MPSETNNSMENINSQGNERRDNLSNETENQTSAREMSRQNLIMRLLENSRGNVHVNRPINRLANENVNSIVNELANRQGLPTYEEIEPSELPSYDTRYDQPPTYEDSVDIIVTSPQEYYRQSQNRGRI
ncbi:MAG: hypothetical protein K6D38_00965 [Pseudobutyrivibrio sp.]|nr:hypothetical protein [Pseudobutyrivibrio sp.]